MVVLAFQERGVEVIAVGNGEAAVRRLPDANPDLILADVFMPVRNGYEVCEFVKKDTRFSHIPVILLVGAFDPLDEKEARRVGADGVLKKPFVPPDPLIAMVMSALEKNPRVIAELAKAKEAKEAAEALVALPAAAMENPAKAEPKPLPEFPEPSPEEAAMIYGFGKGVRAIDSGETEEDEDEVDAKSSKSARGLKDPQKSQKKSKTPAVSAPKTPVVAMEEEDEGDFDSSATASDWRRNAADFEVPDNVEANPVYSYGKGFEAITFPSEKDVPPKHVRSEDSAQDENSEQSASDAGSQPAGSAHWDLKAADEAEISPSTTAIHSESPLESTSTAEISQVKSQANSLVNSKVDSRASALEHYSENAATEPAAPVVAAEATPQGTTPEISSEAPVHAAPPAKPSFVARVRGWMDMMTPSSDEATETESASPDAHWMTSLAAPAISSEIIETQHANVGADVPAALQASDIENPVKLAEAESLAETAAIPAAVEASEPNPTASSFGHEAHAEAISEEPFEARSAANVDDTHSEPVPFKTQQIESPAYGSASSHHQQGEHRETEAVATDDSFFQEPVRAEHSAAEDDALPQISAEGPSGEFHAPASDKWTDSLSASARLPEHDNPATEHLPLEPMISDLHGPAESSAGFSDHEPSHVTKWLAQRTQQPDAPRTDESLPSGSAHTEPNGDAWSEHHLAAGTDHQPFADQVEPSLFEREPSAPAFAEEFAERIPTLPPPNREALSQIPFLMPHTEREPSGLDGMDGSNNAAIDEVVRRVLEKLRPQLNELLTQGVKPLVENMLQNELKGEFHKNEK